MVNKFIYIHANLAHDHIDSNIRFLESVSGAPLLKEIARFFESWNEADKMVSDVLKGSGSNSMMRFVVDYVWFPSLFSIMMDILVSTLDSVCRTIRFLLEGLELGLVLDCSNEFRELKLVEKWEHAAEFGSSRSRLMNYIEELLQKDVLDELKEFYSILSRKWIHTPSYLNELLQDTLRRGGELPVKILYFPLLEEREDEINELVRILNKFNKYALILVKKWKERCLRNNR
jgi:hypothetical protein